MLTVRSSGLLAPAATFRLAATVARVAAASAAVAVCSLLPAAAQSPPAPLPDAREPVVAQSQAVEPAPPAAPAAVPETAAAPSAPSPWAGTFELYGFAPVHTSTSTTIRGLTSDVDLNLGQVLRNLTGAFAARGSVEYGRLGLLGDFSYAGIEAKPLNVRGIAGRRTLTATVANDQRIFDLALRYRFGDRERAIGTPGSLTVIPYAGVRIVDEGLRIVTTFQTPRRIGSETRSFGGPVVQPLIGTQAQVFVAPRLRLFARGDVGGFGINGPVDLSANAQLGVGYAIGSATQLDLSWRYLHLARDNGATPKNAYDVDQNGIELGVKFFF